MSRAQLRATEGAIRTRFDALRGSADPVLSVDVSRRRRATIMSDAPGANTSSRSTLWLVALSYTLIITIVVLDWMTPPGVAVAVLLSLPFMLLSLVDDARHIWLAGAVTLLARFADIFFARPTMPSAILQPNRVLVTISVVASIVLAHVLFRQRRSAQRARDAALDARDMNRLLVSLMAHDLRSPLVVANDALAYAERTAVQDVPVDTALLSDARVRLQRSLRTIESILAVARADASQDETRSDDFHPPVSIRSAVTEELALFGPEASARGKSLVSHLYLADGEEWLPALDAQVARQGLAILLDNAIRYANAGRIDVEVFMSDRDLCVRVSDSGPGFSASRAVPASMPSGGSGLGLELCRALLKRAGARLELERDDAAGTAFILRLPTHSRGDERRDVGGSRTS
jgi:signal transduction histidine kinase